MPRCVGCGTCAEECPSTALEIMGKTWTLERLLHEVAKDKAYFEKSEGGITVSGGDPTMQADFVAAFLDGCRERGLHTALDTCGLCTEKALDKLLPRADMVLFDLKVMDPAKHKQFTGHGNERILENCLRIRDAVLAPGGPREMWIRTPIIPGCTNDDENIRAIGAFVGANLGKAVTHWDLCAFNNLCRDKYERLGLDWELRDCDLMEKQEMDHIAEVARKSGADPKIVQWSGSTKREESEQGDEQKESAPDLRLVKDCCGN